MSAELSAPAEPVKNHTPGEAGIWVFILGDMAVFAVFFAVYTFYFSREPALFLQSQKTLNLGYGLVNTFLLLTSSWFVVLGVNGVRKGLSAVSARLFAFALLGGIAFAVIKVIEYSEKVGAGINPLTNDFYMYYFVLTGIHFLHVLIGLVLLVFLIRVARSGGSRARLPFVEIGASYWHMVDLLWIVLFCLLYLMK